MIDKLKAILLEAINDLESTRAPMLPKEDITVRQALERLRAEHDDMVSLQIEWQSYGSGRPFTVTYKAYSGASGANGWTGDLPSLAAALAAVAGDQSADAAQTADELLASVTSPEPPATMEPLPY